VRRYLFSVVVCLLTSILLQAQSPKPTLQSSSHGPVTVVKLGSGIEPPALSNFDYSAIISAKCERKFSGKVELSLIVDSTGKPQNIGFIKAETTDIDRLAVVLAGMDRFTPARQGENAIATGESLELQLQGCVASTIDKAGQKTYRLLLASPPKQKLKPYNSFPPEVIFATETLPPNPRSSAESRKYRVGGTVTAPVPMNTPEAEYSPEGRKQRINGECMISVFVDAFGLPEYPVVVRPLEPTMDQKALEAVSRYRFKPAMRDGMEPVPVLVTIAVNFRLG
jgi:TonB family protein